MNETEAGFVGQVLTWGVVGLGGVLLAVIKFLDVRNSKAKEDFRQTVEPELKALRERLAFAEKRVEVTEARITALENGQRESVAYMREIFGIAIELNHVQLKELAKKAEDALHK